MKTAQTSYDKNKIKFLILEGSHRISLDILKDAGYENIDYLPHALSEEELLNIIGDYHFIGGRSRTRFPAHVLAKATKLMGLGTYSVGTNQIDIQAAKKLGVPVFNAPFASTRSVAEYVIGASIMLMRGLIEKNAKAHRGEWQKTVKNAHELRGKKLGIIGYGNIGSQVGVMAELMGMDVIYYNPSEKLPLGNAKALPTMNEVLKTADIVTLHVPETTETKNMIGLPQLQLMKKGAHLINAARGSVVDIEALTQSLEEQHLAGAALDVYPTEPKSTDESFESSLKKFDNVLLSPHIGGSTLEAQVGIAKHVTNRLIQYCNTGNTKLSVNFPQVTLPPHPQKRRIIHIHRNEPGVLMAINQVFADQEVNISGQYLETDTDIGYVAVDIDAKIEKPNLRKALQDIPGTIKTRILF